MGFKSQAAELQTRMQIYQQDNDQAVQDQRDSKKEVRRLIYQNDELQEKCYYLEKRFNQLGQRLGATQEDIDALDRENDQPDYKATGYKTRPKQQKKQIVEPLDPYP